MKVNKDYKNYINIMNADTVIGYILLYIIHA